jgi:hypothetical protein
MKYLIHLLGFLGVAAAANAQSSVLPPDGLLLVDAGKSPRALPFIYASEVETELVAKAAALEHHSTVKTRVLQGKPGAIVLDLTGDSKVTAVTGDWIASWAVRSEQGASGARQVLEILAKPTADGAAVPVELVCRVEAANAVTSLPVEVAPALLGIGRAAGFAARITLRGDGGVEPVVLASDGLTASGPLDGPKLFLAQGSPSLKLQLATAGASAGVELVDAKLTLTIDAGKKIARGELTAMANVRQAGATVTILRGNAAMTELPAGDAVGARVAGAGETALVFRSTGAHPVRVDFVAPILPIATWQGFDFAIPAGAVIPVAITGLADAVECDPAAAVFPVSGVADLLAHLPADGTCDMRWRAARGEASGKVFLNSAALADTWVASGMIRQSIRLDLRTLQGEISALDLAIDGTGEVLGVDGGNVAGWATQTDGGKRVLAVRFGRPLRGRDVITVTGQAPVGAMPATVDLMRLTPVGVDARHSGFLRVSGVGAARVEVAEPTGLMQLAAGQWPGGQAPANARQTVVFRFPTPDFRCKLRVDQIVPEINVNQILVHELGESDRVLHADLEIDVREAPVREWDLLVPADHALASVEGADIADFVPGGEDGNKLRRLKILFKEPVIGRRLIALRMERNIPAAAGAWELPGLAFPGARAARGFLGVVCSPGFRAVPAAMDGLVETPIGYFPKQHDGLQHTFRIRDGKWSARLDVTALGQNVQADLFHLYTLREGMVAGSVLANFYTTGAPATEWRFSVPARCGNLGIDGQGVRGWRREGDTVIVALDKPSLGAATVLLTFEQPLAARGGVIHPGEIHPVGVQGERGFIQVVSPFQIRQSVVKAEGKLLKLEPTELRAELRLLTSAPSLAVYQYNDRPIQLEMQVNGFDPAESADQLVDFARLASTVAWDGQVVTEASWFVKSRGRGVMRLRLPAGATLWEATAAGAPVNARDDNGFTLIPIPAEGAPVTPVEITVRYGQPAGKQGTLDLTAPRVDAPIAMAEWEVKADRGRVLVPSSGSVLLDDRTGAVPARRDRSGVALWWAILLAAGAAIASVILRGRGRVFLALLAGITAILVLVVGALAVMPSHPPGASILRFVAPVVPAGEAMTVRVRNLAPWQVAIPWTSIVLGLAAAGLAIGSWIQRNRPHGRAAILATAAWLALATAGLLLHAGHAAFLVVLATLVGWIALLPAARHWLHARAAAAILVCALAMLAPTPGAAAAAPVVESITQVWQVGNGRILATATLRLDLAAGQAVPVLHAPASLSRFTGEGLKIVPSNVDNKPVFLAVAARAGRFTASMDYELRVGDGDSVIRLPTATAAVHLLRVEFSRAGWEAACAGAMQVDRLGGLADGRSGTALVLAPGASEITLRPQTRDPAAETVRYFAESGNLFIPSAGIINGRHKLTIRPTQGQIDKLAVRVPGKFTVGDVAAPGLADWKFDPATRLLAFVFAPARTEPFAIEIISQMPVGQLPYDAALAPIHAEGATGEVGMTALAFAGDAQPDAIKPVGMALMDAGDFDRGLLGDNKAGSALILHQVFRHEGNAASLGLRVLPVQPEIKVQATQLLSLGEERVVLAADLDVEISRAGIFNVSFALPPGLEPEAATGEAVTHWSEAKDGAARVITIHLAGRTLGRTKISLNLAGPMPAAQPSWDVPRILVREATRQTGDLTIVPERGIRARALTRQNATPTAAPQGKGLPAGALAFRLLQPDWQLAIGIERLEPWITSRLLHEATVRDGQTRTRIGMQLRVENAAIKHVRLRLPALDAEDARSVRATGEAVADIQPVAGEDGMWTLSFQRGVLGEVPVDIQYQQKNDPAGAGFAMPIARVEDSRQSTAFLALRSTGRIGLEANVLPQGWYRADWPLVPEGLQDPTERGAPALCFRAADPDEPLAVAIRRHEVAEVLKLRVGHARLVSVVAPAGNAITTAELSVHVAEKASLRLSLPAGASLLALTVNGQSTALAREDNAILFHILPGPDTSAAASVRFAYATAGGKGRSVHLGAPALDVPIEDAEWQVCLPPGHVLRSHKGGLVLRAESGGAAKAGFGLDDYLRGIAAEKQAELARGSKDLAEGNRWLAEGKAEKARAAFSQAAANGALDAPSNEDARVQLRNLQSQQVVVGLNTMRQKIVLDNAGNKDAAANEQIARAARENPLLQGGREFDPRQLDRLLQGNTSEETSALKRLADRIVSQQAAASQSLRSLDVATPAGGQSYTFARSVQVDGSAPLVLDLEMTATASTGNAVMVAAMLVLTAALAFFGIRRMKAE